MNWGDIQIESLKKMFLNKDDLNVDNLNAYKKSKDYKTYLFAMPQACNEAINYILSICGGKEAIEEIARTDTNDTYDLSELIDNFRMLKDVFCPNNVRWKTLSKNTLEIDNWNSGTVKVLYELKPIYITSTTSISEEIVLDDELSTLIPLYIAGELYKDDDIALATMYMNEFITLVDNYNLNNKNINNPSIKTIYSME